MSKNFVQPGRYIEVTAPAIVASGALVKVGQIFGVAQHDAASGAPVQLDTQGVYTLPAASAVVIAVGDALFWDVADGNFNKTAASNHYLGVAVGASGNGATTVDIRLNGALPAAAGA